MRALINSFAILCLLVCAVHAQEMEKQYLVLETSSTSARPTGEWKTEVPYKRPVRIISELFDFPVGYDAARETDAKIQFLEYVMKHNRGAIEKMKLHGPMFGKPFFKSTNKISVDSFTHARDVAQVGSFNYDIIVIKDFKYQVDKYLGPKRKGRVPLYDEAMEIMYGKWY